MAVSCIGRNRGLRVAAPALVRRRSISARADLWNRDVVRRPQSPMREGDPLMFESSVLDSLDVKVLALTGGVSVDDAVYRRFGGTHRLSRDPLECSAFILPDQTVVHLADVGPGAAMSIVLDDRDGAILKLGGEPLCPVGFPAATDFYDQRTSRGLPFRGSAVLQGIDVLSFPYLWPCELAASGLACRFCHLGNRTQALAAQGAGDGAPLSPADAAEIVDYALNIARCAHYVQITGGTTLDADGECDRVAHLLREIDKKANLSRIAGEVVVFTTPPCDPREVDAIFAAGAHRIACDIEIWDESIARDICPGKASRVGRQRYLATLEYIARKYGPNKACSAFVVGLEPAESFLAAAEYLASRGIVPIPSIWMGFGLPALADHPPPGLEFYRKVKVGLANIYEKYGCEPPGTAGYNVCLCRDTWRHRREILESSTLLE